MTHPPVDLDLLEQRARAIRLRNQSSKRGHPKYTASMTSEDEMTLTEGCLALVARVRELEAGLGEALMMAASPYVQTPPATHFTNDTVVKPDRISRLRALLAKETGGE